MTALALPIRYSKARGNLALCARIGIRLDGVDMGKTVIAYDVPEGWVRTIDARLLKGVVEPYWRTPT
jgi:hypothetical protein